VIPNLTQHPATPEQQTAGVCDLSGAALGLLKEALTFAELPTREDIALRSGIIADLAHNLGEDVTQAMIGGAGYLMPALERALWDRAIEPLHAFTVRQTVETAGPDGAVTKTAVFRHGGFVPGA